MNSVLKRELAVVSGVAAVGAALLRSKFWTGAFGLTSAALVYSSLHKKFDWTGKNAYITGGSRGLGLSLAWNLLAQGARVCLVARDDQELTLGRQHLLRDFPQGRIWTHPCDITNRTQLSESLKLAVQQMGGIDLLVNNAGAILVGPFETMEMADFEAQMRLHLFAAISATQLLLPHFKSRGSGRILNISSLGGKVAVPHMLAYDASKFALTGFSQGIRAELAPLGISVTTAYPSVMRTGSPLQAVFKGEHEKEFAWFASLDNMPGLSTSADVAAKRVLEAVADGRAEIILSRVGQLREMMSSIFPETMAAFLGVAAQMLPKGHSQRRKTGAQSSKTFDKSTMLSPLRKAAERASHEYNQHPGHDPDWALGIQAHEEPH